MGPTLRMRQLRHRSENLSETRCARGHAAGVKLNLADPQSHVLTATTKLTESGRAARVVGDEWPKWWELFPESSPGLPIPNLVSSQRWGFCVENLSKPLPGCFGAE